MKFHFLHRWQHYATIQNGALALGLLIAISWVWGTVGTLNRNFQLQQQVDQLDQQIDLAKLQNQNLAYQKNYFNSSEYLELSARELLGKVAPGEHLILLPDSSGVSDIAATAQPSSSATEPGNFTQWMQFFFGDKQTES